MTLIIIENLETKQSIADFLESVEETEVIKEQFFDNWAKSKNQKIALHNAKIDDYAVEIFEDYEFLMFEKMQAAIKKELNAPFRCSEWKL